MPVVSEAQLSRIQNHMARLHHRARHSVMRMREQKVMHRVATTAWVVGGAGGFGWMQGQWTARGHSWSIMGFNATLVSGIALAAGAYLGSFGRWNDVALDIANGALAGFAAQAGYAHGHSAGLSGKLIAGDLE